MKKSRRKFIKTAATTVAGLTVGLNTFTSSQTIRAIGPNDKIRMGFIGIGNRGSQLLAFFMTQPDCEVAALCDVYEPYVLRDPSKVDQRYFKERIRQIPPMGEVFSKTPAIYTDYRKLLEDKSIDAVCIGTPDHWHALQTIDAIKAGKDVFVEKPLTNTLLEGRKMVDAWAASNRIVTVGINGRGSTMIRKLVEKISAGQIGKITFARAAHISNMFPDGIGKMKPEQPPKGLNWDMWLGPREYRPYQYNIAPYKFRWWSDYSSQMGNWGVHYLDAIRWIMGEIAPVAITAIGGKYAIDDDRTIPDTMEVIFEFASKAIVTFSIFESSSDRLLPFGDVELRGTKGTLYFDYVSETGYRIIPSKPGQFQNWKPLIEAEEFNSEKGALMNPDGSSTMGAVNNIRNFLDCVKTRKTPYCTLEDGHRSTSFAHLANISLAVKQRLEWDSVKERFTNSEKANQLLSYEYRKPWEI